jgi:hypothetical protein
MVDASVRGCYEGIAKGEEIDWGRGEWFGWLGGGDGRGDGGLFQDRFLLGRGERDGSDLGAPPGLRRRIADPNHSRCGARPRLLFPFFDTSTGLFLSLGFCVWAIILFSFFPTRCTYYQSHRRIDACRCPSGCIFNEECFSVSMSMLVSRNAN